MVADFRCIGGVDVDAASIRDFGRLAGVPGTVLDLFDREQFEAFHGHAAALRLARGHAGGHPRRRRSRAAAYRLPVGALARLQRAPERGEVAEPEIPGAEQAHAPRHLPAAGGLQGRPSELLLFENVPRIANRGRKLLDRITGLLRAYGYIVAETTHDCGRLGGARSVAQALPPGRSAPRKGAAVPLRAAEALAPCRGRRARPHADAGRPSRGGRCTGLPSLHWQTWVRLAFVEAGSDWRSLSKLATDDGMLRDFALQPDEDWRAGVLGSARAGRTRSVTVAGRSTPHQRRLQCGGPALGLV